MVVHQILIKVRTYSVDPNKCTIFNKWIFVSLGKSYFSRIEDHISEETNQYVDGLTLPSMGSPARSSPHSQGSEVNERFSRKVFVGGLPPDIDEGMLAHRYFHSWLYSYFCKSFKQCSFYLAIGR